MRITRAFPESVYALDIETCGTASKVLLQYAGAWFQSAVMLNSRCFIVKHNKMPQITPEAAALHGIDEPAMRHGMPFTEAQRLLKAYLSGVIANRESALVGFNLYALDLPVIVRDIFEGKHHVFRDTRVVDVGLLYKAMAMGMKRRSGESDHAYWLRSYNTRATGLRWSLDTVCRDLGLPGRCGKHDAMDDVMLTHQIYRKMSKSQEYIDFMSAAV